MTFMYIEDFAPVRGITFDSRNRNGVSGGIVGPQSPCTGAYGSSTIASRLSTDSYSLPGTGSEVIIVTHLNWDRAVQTKDKELSLVDDFPLFTVVSFYFSHHKKHISIRNASCPNDPSA